MTALQPGQMLGPYQIISQIGQGGMATVYKAYHAAMDRYVALKVVATQLSSEPDFLQRFRQEARLIARLEHPRILPVYDYGEADGIPYMVMRFLDAGTLKERLSSAPLSLQEVDHIFSELADALAYAHENGVIHRDIKPSNAMLDKRGDIFLTDFGVAKMLEGSSGLTATGAVTGTPAYMSPEQAQGLKVDQRSDIYSLGVVLFEMLTGHVPFEAETPMAVLFKQIQTPPPPLSVVRPDLPYPLESVLLKALAKNPTDRYASMQAFEQGWKQALAEASTLPATPRPPQNPPLPAEPAASTPLPSAAPAPAPKRGFPVAALVIIGSLICVGIGVLLAVRVADRVRTQQATRQALLQTPTGAAPAPAGPGQTPAAAGKVASWAAANSVYAIAFRDNQVLAGGPGGLTLWQRSDWSFQQLGTAGGLPSAYVDALLVDADKSVWIATDAGLVHVSGTHNSLYTSDQGLDSEDVTALARAGSRLYAGSQYAGVTGSGLQELNDDKWKAVAGFPSKENPDSASVSYNVNQITADPAGNLWVATQDGIARLDTGGHWQVFKLSPKPDDDNIYTIYVDKDNNILAGTTHAAVEKYDPARQAFGKYLDLNSQGITDIYAIQQDRDGNLWFAGDNVARYEPGSDQWTRYSADDGSLPVHSARSIGMDDQGTLYFGTDEEGLLRYSGGKFSVSRVPNTPRFAEYGRILPGPDGKLVFVELYGNGADQFDPKTQTWTSLPAEQHTPLAYDARGQLWSTDGDGLWIFARDKTTHLTTAQGLPSNEIHALVFGPLGAAYIATDAGIAVFDGQHVGRTITAAGDGLSSNNILSLFITREGVLWAGTDKGFSRRLADGKWQHFTSQQLFGSDAGAFSEFAPAKNGDIWIATGSDGLYHLANGKWERLLSTDPGVGLPGDDVISVRTAQAPAQDVVWAGTDGEGAVRYDGSAWKVFGLKDGLIDPHVNDIFLTPDGTAWFATNGGISMLRP